MKCCCLIFSLLAPILLSGATADPFHSQTAANKRSDVVSPKPPKPQFFAGLVIEADAEHIKVSRVLVGRPAETHVFAVDSKTKTPRGGIKVKSRVTVRYEHGSDRDLALEVQVRPANHTQKAS